MTRPRRAVALLAAFGVLGSSALLGSSPAQGASPSGAVLRYGELTLGVNEYGELNYDCPEFEDGGCPGPAYGTDSSVVGLRRTIIEDDLDGISPGDPDEGWGIADATTNVTGWSNQRDGGPHGLDRQSFATTDDTATSVTSVGSGERGPRLQVTHRYGPSANSNLFEGTVTVTNTGTRAAGDVRYRRTVDWDIPPTAFDEYVTVAGTPPELLFDSDLFGPDEVGEGGRAGLAAGPRHVRPLGARTYGYSESVCGQGYTGPCQFTDLGDGTDRPADHGALFDFGLGPLAPGQSLTFRLFYGVALSEKGALASLRAVGAQTYTLGQSSCEFGSVSTCIPRPIAPGARAPLAARGAGPEDGEPATFMLGFAFPTADVSVDKTAPATATVGDTITYSLTARNNTRGVRANGVVISDPLPTGTTFVSSSTGCTGTTTVRCAIGQLEPFASKTATITVRATTSGVKTNVASVTSRTSDGNPANNRDSATTDVSAGNHAPVARNDGYRTDLDTELVVSAPGVQSNDIDPDGDPLTVQLVSGPAHGTATLDANGRFRYVPDDGYTGADTLRYRASDPSGATDTARVRITVDPVAPGTTAPSDTPTTPSSDTPSDAPSDAPSDTPSDTPTDTPTDDASEPAISASPTANPPVVGLKLSTPSVNPGGRLDATGSGCGANASVRLSVEGRDAGTGTADGDGNFTVPITAPDLPVGNHTVTAVCGSLQQIAPVSFVYVTSESSAPGAKALTVGAMLAFFLLLLTLTLRRPGR